MTTVDLLVRNGTVVTELESFRADIAITGETITAVGNLSAVKARSQIDAHDLLVLPGGIDVHVHMSFPFGETVSSDDFHSGSRAAACGGVTTMIDFARKGGTNSLLEAIEERRAIAEQDTCIDFSLHAIVTDVNEETLSEIPRAIACGVPTFKAFTAYAKEGLMLSQDELGLLLRTIARCRAQLDIHAEKADLIEHLSNGFISSGKTAISYHPLSHPPESESRAIGEIISILGDLRCPIYFHHVSTAQGVELIHRVKEEGRPVYAETCPHYLILSDECYHRRDGIHYAVSPPLRETQHQEALWEAVEEGTIQVIATDHCPFASEQKTEGQDLFTKVPNGMPGIETRLVLLFTEGVEKRRIGLTHLVQLFSFNPARLFGLYPKKGCIAKGSDADLVILDPKRRKRISAKRLHMNCDWSPYEGMKATGWPVITLLRGKVIYQEGEFIGHSGHGQFVERTLKGHEAFRSTSFEGNDAVTRGRKDGR